MINKAYVPIDINESLFMHRILLHIEGMNMFFKEVLKIVSPDGKKYYFIYLSLIHVY